MVIEFELESASIDDAGQFKSIPALKIKENGIPFSNEIIVGLPHSTNLNWFENNVDANIEFDPNSSTMEKSKGLSEEIEFLVDENIVPDQTVIMAAGPTIRGNTSIVITVHPIVRINDTFSLFRQLTIHLTWNTPQSTRSTGFLSHKSFRDIPVQAASTRLITTHDVPAYQYSENLIRVLVDTSGWYTITYDDLADSISLSNLDPRTFQLWHGDDEQFITVIGEFDGSFDQGDNIIFQGFPAPPPDGVDYRNNFYTNDNMYWLTWGGNPGLRYIEESAYPDLPLNDTHQPATYRTQLHIEKDEFFTRLGSMRLHQQWDTFDHFFMNPAIDAGTIRPFDLIIPTPDGSDLSQATLRLNFQGITTGDHIVQFLINSHLAGSGSWANQETKTIEGSISQEFLTDGLNTLEVLNQENSSESNPYDQVYLNWIEIEYSRLFKASRDEIIFRRNGDISATTQFEIDGFSSSDIRIYKEGVSQLSDFVITWNTQDEAYTVILQDYIDGESPDYHAFTEDRLRSPRRIRLESPLPNIQSIPESDYVIVSPDSFFVSIEPLREYRNATMVNVDHIYRWFTNGVTSPYAIKEFFSWTYQNWDQPQTHVLLAMQGKWMGWHGTSYYRQDFIPSMRIQTLGFGAVSSDFWYTTVQGDDHIPEFAIGRFSVSGKQELETMVSKTLEHSESSYRNWNWEVLNIGGYEETFKNQSEMLIPQEIHQGFFPLRLYIDQYSEGGDFYGSTDTLVHYLNRGVSYINFLGHGGGAVWADRSLLHGDDVDLIENPGKYPIVTSMTCFSGDVTNPDALGRLMLAKENAGAVGWFGSAGVGWIINDFLLLQPLHQRLFARNDLSLGDIINQGKIEYLATNSTFPNHAISQIYQFNLSGDPALVFHRGLELDAQISPGDPEPGEEVEVVSTADSLQFQLYNSDYYPGQKYPHPLNSTNYTLPDSIDPGVYTMNVMGKENEEWKSNSLPVNISGTTIHWVSISPERPSRSDSIDITIEAIDRHGIDSLFLWVNNVKERYFVNTTGDEYILETPLLLTVSGGTYNLRVEAVDTQNAISWSTTKQVRVKQVIDIHPEELSFFYGDSIYLKARIENGIHESGSGQLIIEKKVESTWQLLVEKPITTNGKGIDAYFVPVLLPSGINHLRLIAIADDPESYTRNDTLTASIEPNAFWVTPELGSTEDLVSHSKVNYFNTTFDILPNTVQNPGILSIKMGNAAGHEHQPGLTAVVDEAISISGIDDITFSGHWYLDSIPSHGELYFWNEEYQLWIPNDYVRTDTSVSFEHNQSGKWGLFSINDTQKPSLEASVNGQRFLQNSYVGSTPTLSIIATDENGVDPTNNNTIVWLDGLRQSDGIVSQKSSNNGSLSINLQPSLSHENSSLAILVHDIAGNPSDTLNLSFIVSEELKLIDYGNYPNPFTDLTRFAYELTESVDEFDLSIFSLDGRRIRRFDESSTLTALDPRIGAFHEIIWDGKTDEGDYVANGVYFYLMKVKKNKQSLESKGKVVKAR